MVSQDGEKYMLCDYSVDHLVDGVTRWRKKIIKAIPGNILLALIIIADLAKLEDDEEDKTPPPAIGFPRYLHILQKRFNKVFEKGVANLEYNGLCDSLYASILNLPSKGDLLGTRSSHASSPQLHAINLDQHSCDAAKAKDLLSKLRSADLSFVDRFMIFLNKLENPLDGAKEDLKRNLCTKLQQELVRGAVREVFTFISEHEAICGRFTADVNQYISDVKAIRQGLEKPPKACCFFRYPHDSLETVDFNCGDLRCLEDGAFISDKLVLLFMVHLKGTYILQELKPSAIHEKYAIMDPLQFDNLAADKFQATRLKRAADKAGSDKAAYIFWPIPEDGHWSLGVICKEENKQPRVLHMDPAGMHDSGVVCQKLAKYMQEVLEINGVIEQRKIQVPKQINGYDCGILMLYIMKKIIEDFDENFTCGREWYRSEDASALRSDIRNLIQENKMKSYASPKCPISKKWASSFAE